LKDLAAVVEHIRQSNVRTVEQLEKQKIKTNSALGRLEQTQGLLSEQLDKCSNKDLLMRTLVRTHHMFLRILNFMCKRENNCLFDKKKIIVVLSF
jgi:hypothetical protein